MMTHECQHLFEENYIVVTKPPGSTSYVTQPADVGQIFKSIKKVLKGLRGVDVYNNDLQDELMHAIESHGDTATKILTASNRKKSCEGLLKLHRAMNKVMNPDIIRELFIETGMYNPISKLRLKQDNGQTKPK